MHFKDDPISDMHAKNYSIILCLMPLSGPSKFGPVLWSRLFRCRPVEYNYPFLGFAEDCNYIFPILCKERKEMGQTI